MRLQARTLELATKIIQRHSVLNVKVLVGSRSFQPGEGPSRGLVIVKTDCRTDGSFHSTSEFL